MKVFRTVILIVLLCIFLCSCHDQISKNSGVLNLTQEVQIECSYRHNLIKRNYKNSDKIDVILRYLHKLPTPGQQATQIAQKNGDRCEITVYLLDGSTHKYQLDNKEFLRIDSGNWYAVDPEKANIIYHLVNHIPSD